MSPIVHRFKQFVALIAVVLLCASCAKTPTLSDNPWEILSLPTEATLSDLAFTSNPQHGWIVGTNAALLETNDGGTTWEARNLDLGEEKVRFDSISFSGDEGWIVGAPFVLLHTEDAGSSWSRIPLSKKLPGSPRKIVALGPQSAEMATDIGAIYRTEDGGQNWKGLVQEAVGVLRTVSRSDDGKYVGVSSRGNFYSVWTPGQEAWSPYNRNSSRRLQNMGFAPNGQLWMLARGGQVQFNTLENPEEWQEEIFPERSQSWGLLGLAYRTPEEIWVVGGSGNLLQSPDGGQTWLKDIDVEDVPSNFYDVKFFSPDRGFVLGQNGTLLRYVGTSQKTVEPSVSSS
jgi:photosystem II stability/assembly factor-like uncharacterized protein